MKSSILSEDLSLNEIFASTLIHSIWQGALIVILLWCLRLLIHKNSRLNYFLPLFALILLVAVSLATFLYLYTQNSLGFFEYSLLSEVLSKPDVLYWFNIIWLVGSSAFFLRFLFSHFYLRKLIHNSKPLVDKEWMSIFSKLKSFYTIQKTVILLMSEKVSSAFLTGVIKPIIIIPTSWVNQLSLKEAECILAHELSHVFNRDHWVNLFIHFTEIIFYFNPAVHILIGHIKLERELNADSSACQYLKEPILYAKLILKIEESSSYVPVVAVPFFRQKQQLKRRIESVLQLNSRNNDFSSKFGMFALIISLLFFSNLKSGHQLEENSISEVCYKTCDLVAFHPIGPIHYKSESRVVKPPKTKSIKETRQEVNKLVKTQKKRSNKILEDEVENEIIAFESNDDHILQQIEREIKEDKKNRKTVIYQLSKTEVEMSESDNGGSGLETRQIKCYAPTETKTYIIIKSRNTQSNEYDIDMNSPGRVRTMSNEKI